MQGVDLSQVDLLAVIGRDTHVKRVAATWGGEYAGACPFCGGKDRFRVWPTDGDRGRWWCRQCGRGGDAIAYLQERDALTFREACERLGAVVVESPRPAARPAIPDVEPPGPQWQNRARAFVTWCQARLWEPTGAAALDYLRGRGLTDETIRRWGLGFNPQRWRRPAAAWGLDGEPVNLAAGIVIPHEADGHLWGVKIRLLETFQAGDGRMIKYTSIRGGKTALVGVDLWGGKTALVLCEGEFDAMILWQQAADLVDVATLAGAGKGLPLRWLVKLLSYKCILAAYDADGAGQKGAARLADLSRRVRIIKPLEGKDVNDFHLAGGDLHAWIAFHLARLGLDQPTAARSCYPVTLTFPGDLGGLAVPPTWRRLADGRIEATFHSRAELALCLEVSTRLQQSKGGYDDATN